MFVLLNVLAKHQLDLDNGSLTKLMMGHCQMYNIASLYPCRLNNIAQQPPVLSKN